ncbi:MAG: hypothetical protein J7493_11605 [Porphyrobacter sp.]|nr:hypothetical protein [Porphyrobacter sp.]
MRAVALSVLLAASASAAPASAQSFVGEWRATAKAPDGEISETLTVEKTTDGYSVTAKDVQPPPAEGMSAGPGQEVKLDGDTFSYKRIVNTAQGPLEIVYNGTVTGDTFTGTGEIMGFSVPYNGVRLKK